MLCNTKKKENRNLSKFSTSDSDNSTETHINMNDLTINLDKEICEKFKIFLLFNDIIIEPEAP